MKSGKHESLVDQLIRHEGYRPHPYLDSVGKLTVGIGRNLDDVGISEREARYLLQNDIDKARDRLAAAKPVLAMLSVQRQHVLVNMAVNLGVNGLLGFKKMWRAIELQDFHEAAVQMLDSKWAAQVGNRATELAAQMEDRGE